MKRENCCKICKKSFIYYTTKTKGIFCSYNCFKIWQKTERYKYYKILTRKYLIKKYGKEKKSLYKIGKEINCSDQTVLDYMRKYNISRRTFSETQKGELNSMFGRRGGKHPRFIKRLNREYPILFNNNLKETIRKRDNYICQECGIKQRNHYRKLDVHHINLNKFNISPQNLIALCQSCHQKITNRTRKYII